MSTETSVMAEPPPEPGLWLNSDSQTFQAKERGGVLRLRANPWAESGIL